MIPGIAIAISLGLNLAMFVPAFLFKTDKLTDISYAVTFILLAVVIFVLGGFSVPSLILLIAILLWAVRLGGYLLIRIYRIGHDKRFDRMRKSFWLFGRFWLLQGITVWVIMLPSIFFLSNAPESLSWASYVGLAIWTIGFVTETIADVQKFKFASDPANKGKWIESGLWRYSRHPNYFGEILLWIGLYIYVVPELNLTKAFVGAIGPIFITLLIVFVSGVRMLEKRATVKWGDNPDYRNYKRRTSILIPWLHRSG